MKSINIANDIVPLADFKVQISKYLNNIKSTGRPMVITQNGKPAGVVLSPDDYDELIYQKSLIESINRGLSDINKGNVFTTEELRAELEKRRA
jgi:antitoxin YefM